MKHKRNALIKSLAIVLAVWMLAGCQQNDEWLGYEDEEDDDASKQTQTSQKVVHLTSEKSVEFVSDKTKESWRAPLEEFLAKVTPHNFPEIDYSDPYSGSYAVSLMDLNLDGTPEIILANPGGSACNVYYLVYDLLTGERLGDLDGGLVETWDYYYNPADDTIRLMVKFRTQAGYATQHHHVSRIEYNKEQNQYDDQYILQFTYSTDDYGIEEGVARAIYVVNGEEVDAETYYEADEEYINTHIRIVDAQKQLFRWVDVVSEDASAEQRAKAMAEALLSSGQEFIKPETKK